MTDSSSGGSASDRSGSRRDPPEPEGHDFTVLSRTEPGAGPGNALAVLVAVTAAAGGAATFAAGIALEASPGVLGAGLGVTFLALAFALRRAYAATYPRIEAVEPRKAHTGRTTPLAAVSPTDRRGLLRKLVAGAGAVALLSLLAPITSLAERRRDVAEATRWRAGLRLVDDRDEPIRADRLEPGGVAQAWPEGLPRQELAAVLLIRLDGIDVQAPTNLDWVVGGDIIAYSKVCTHAGCPVALYQADQAQLFCPCHQASFDAARGARPVFGPASRALPQLPLGTDEGGYLVALGDFVAPVGPPAG